MQFDVRFKFLVKLFINFQETLEPRRESEFYELLNTYQNTSKNLRNVKSDIEVVYTMILRCYIDPLL